ncbi:MAG: hypothetical protein JW940_28325 [Polyangiaceae bacterium]|nr:hypothetical protein [Polyangiaceae bacterium]
MSWTSERAAVRFGAGPRGVDKTPGCDRSSPKDVPAALLGWETAAARRAGGGVGQQATASSHTQAAVRT